MAVVPKLCTKAPKGAIENSQGLPGISRGTQRHLLVMVRTTFNVCAFFFQMSTTLLQHEYLLSCLGITA